ncbi:HD domain-containing protein [Trichococcus shcherbakoviae]|uniref:HD domain-containing protein n=1 Tax=Trichococcus shcherbakoviae subsp. psychrophilus TaxID=2585775 RepID=A0A5C5E5T1_9LACT|nr:HD domain-containing protein [Trichococcus shcherbakoviae]TNV67853.1 HD domain-containing protein [Trichococcus shcherbakoviae subsp. psychrophilus]
MLEELAFEIAKEAHAGQTDKAGLDYILHPLQVAAEMTTDEEKAVALLHDIIEDTDVTASELLARGLPDNVVEAVEALTKKHNQNYAAYLAGVKKNRLARAVKLADLKHNSDLTRLEKITQKDRDRAEKYRKAIEYLSD